MTRTTKGKKRRKTLKLMIVIVLLVFLVSTGLLSFMYIGTVMAPSTPEETVEDTITGDIVDDSVMTGVRDLGLETGSMQ